MSLPPDGVRSQIAEAKRLLQQLLKRQQGINDEVEDLRNLIRANINFLPENEKLQETYLLEFLKLPVNISEAVRLALFIATTADQKVTPLEIKAVAEKVGFDFSEYSNPMASIHTILKRMREAVPPQVEYDEESGTYSFGSSVSAPTDVIDPTIVPEIFAKALEELTAEDRSKVLSTTYKVAKEAVVRRTNAARKHHSDE